MRIMATIKNIIISLLAYIWAALFANRKLKKCNIKNILLIFPYGIGNAVLANGALRSIKKYYPDSELTAIYMQQPTREILVILGGFKDLIYYDMSSSNKENSRFIKELSNKKFDFAINFFAQGSYVFNRMLMYARVPIRIGFRLPEGFGGFKSVLFMSHYIKYDPSISEFKNDLNLLNILNIPLENSISFNLNKYNIVRDDNKIRIGIHVGRSNPQKPGWSVEKFSELIVLLKQCYGARIFVFGGSKEEEVSTYLESKLKDYIVNYIGRKSLSETIDYVHSMDLFISNDTGLMHIAASQNVPLVALFGPTDKVKSRPISDKDETVSIISLNLPCSPCYPLKVGLSCSNSYTCIETIDKDLVFEKVKSMLSNLETRLFK